MYERSAIVLERFFENLLGLNKVNNLKKNFNNYCELFEKFKIVQKANSEEFAALKEFQDTENEIEEIQNHEEKLYKKNAKLEYNRDLIFQDINQKPDEIEKCSLKIEGDIRKNQDKLISLREEFVEAVKDYNEKKSVLSKCKKIRKKAEAEYNAIFEETQLNLENIDDEHITVAKEFAESAIQQDVIKALSENGKDEKIPFNNQVITSAARIGFDITSREIEAYLEAYKLAKKLIKELLDGAVSMELHEKNIRNISVKLNFLKAEKEYIVGFLDYERITVIYGKRMHRSLMIDACEKLEKDIEQVENLYKILLKEIAEKSTKKAYRDLYNKSYLMEIEDKDAKFKKEKNRVNLSTGTIMNSNYWRIEGIKNIYTVFYKNAVEVFGKDLDEFEIPKEQEDSISDEGIDLEVQESVKEDISEFKNLENEIDNVLNQIDNLEETEISRKSLKLAKIVKKRGRKKAKHYTRQIIEIQEVEQHSKLEKLTEVHAKIDNEKLAENVSEEFDIFGEKYQNIEPQIAQLEDLEEYKKAKAKSKEDYLDDIEEESIFDSIQAESENIDFAEVDLEENIINSKSKNKIFNSLKKLNSKSKKKLANE